MSDVHATAHSTERAEETAKRVGSFADVLRRLGVIILVVSAVSFLIQGWAGWDTLSRYYYFLGFGCVLVALGLVCRTLFGDRASAIAFLGIAAFFIPVHFSELGALLYSLGNEAPAEFPRALVLIASSSASVVIASAVTLAVAVPTVWLAFRSLGTRSDTLLALLYMLANIALLIPTRAPGHVLLIGGAVFFATVMFDATRFALDENLRTAAGRATRSMLFVPFLILLGRSSLYGMSHFLTSLMLLSLAGAMFVYAPRLSRDLRSVSTVRYLSMLPAALAWHHLLTGLLLPLEGGLLIDFRIPLEYLPISLLLLAVSFQVGGDGRGYRRLAGVIALGSVLTQLVIVGGIGSAFLCVIVSSLLLSLAFAVEERGLFYAGSFGLVVGLVDHLRYARFFHELSPWIVLGILGVVLVLTSSVLAKSYRTISARVGALCGTVRSWE